MNRYRLILLDLDGTLVHCGGAGRHSLERALREISGRADADLAALRLDGSTDRLIMRQAMEIFGHPFSEDGCDRALARYVEVLTEELACHSYRVYPGVVELLEALRRAAVPYGLCTGNVMEGARLKLRRGGLEAFFEWGPGVVGGFADDGEVRTRIVEAALRRAAARHGPIDPTQVLVVGDTPLDVGAAHGAGCAALGVATGRFKAAELSAAGAEHVVESLRAPAALELLLGSHAP